MPNRLIRRLAREVRFAWREQPTRYDLEELEANTLRVGLVIRLRWALVATLAIFSLVAAAIYSREMPLTVLAGKIEVPVLAILFVLAYNTFYQLTYKRLGDIRLLNHAQLLFDVIVATVLIYYSGGVYSWFASMYLLFIVEGGLILPKRRDVWIVAGFAALAYGIVLGAVYVGIVPHVAMPFVDNTLQRHQSYVLVRYLWNITMMGAAATLTTLMAGVMRTREERLKVVSERDETTGLWDRDYFDRNFAAEIERARTGLTRVYLALIDLDSFERVNRSFGFLTGNAVLRGVADELLRVASENGGDMNVVARYGGEEFAAMTSGTRSEESAERALELAERMRKAVEDLRVEGVSVTASIGLAVFPDDGQLADDVQAGADQALYAAVQKGGNRVEVSGGMEMAGPLE